MLHVNIRKEKRPMAIWTRVPAGPIISQESEDLSPIEVPRIGIFEIDILLPSK